jgi:hypothetical protein
VVDERVRKECQDRGPASATPLDEERGDFVYALPPSLDSEELGPREDGVPGHPNGTVRVYRPSPSFTAQVRGRWPTTSEHSLFDPGAWDAAVARWEESHDPEAAPDQVGVDVAREGGDDTVAAPLWGEAAATLLQAYVDAQDAGHERVEELKASRRARIGELVVVAPGDGVSVAQALDLRFPLSPFNVDEVGVGGSPLDHLRRVLGRQVAGFSGAAVGSPQVAGTPLCENLRTSAYVFAARMVKLGLVDVPSDPLLREEVLAHLVEHKSRTVEEGFRKVRKPSVLLVSKSEVKKTLGRSPDRADAFVIALWAPEKSSPAKVVRVM